MQQHARNDDRLKMRVPRFVFKAPCFDRNDGKIVAATDEIATGSFTFAQDDGAFARLTLCFALSDGAFVGGEVVIETVTDEIEAGSLAFAKDDGAFAKLTVGFELVENEGIGAPPPTPPL